MKTRSYVLHDDYETFATQYLGIDYEDFVNMELGFDESLYEFDDEKEKDLVPC